VHGHALVAAHGDDFAFEVAHEGGEAALVDGELAEAVAAGVLVGFCDDPGGRVAYAEVEDFALLDEDVE